MSDFLALQTNFPKLKAITENTPVAYFCAEFALADELPIYSGGLGVLAGDVVLEAGKLGLPLVGVGLLYKQGYFTQVIDEAGLQEELPAFHNFSALPLTKLHNAEYEPLQTRIFLEDREVKIQLWEYSKNNTRVILLDTDLETNNELDRRLTLSLYPKDSDWRIQQEIILGIGGVRAMSALKLEPSVYHMNEGHSAFGILEVAHQFMKQLDINFTEAFKMACSKVVFTNHTLIPSGNDIFHQDQVTRLLNSYAKHLGLPVTEMVAMGAIPESQGYFSMTHLALSASKRISAVSRSHAQFAKITWPDFELLPITNGVSLQNWQNPRFLDISLKISRGFEVSQGSIWRTHQDLKEELGEYVTGISGKAFNLDALTVTWARRIAAYKQPLLIFSDMVRLVKLLNNENLPVQIIMAGKAHPGDELGKSFISEILKKIYQFDLENKIFFLPNYNLKMAKMLTSASDVWLNTPEKGKEACGTSGMKASLNGVLQMAISDGWTDEVSLADIGFVLDPINPASSFYEVMENKLMLEFFNRNPHGLPEAWVEKMQKAIQIAESRFTSERMLNEYIEKLYLPVLEN